MSLPPRPVNLTVVLGLVVGVALSGALGCGHGGREVVVYTSVDQVFSEPILREFERKTGIKVRTVFDTEETKSTGVLNRLISEAQSPQADIFWSGDPVRPFLLIKRGLVAPYKSPNASGIPDAFRAADGSWTGFAARARVILVNRHRIGAGESPHSIADFTNPRWRGQIAIANPLFGTTTTHIAALFAIWGEERARRFLSELKANGVRIASSNGEVKRLVAAGDVAFGLADTDDANEAQKEGAPVEVVYPDQDGIGTFVMPTTVSLIRGAPHPEEGKRLIDDLLSSETEGRMAEAAAHMPLRSDVSVPAHVRKVGDLRTLTVDYARVASEVERIQPWLRQWVGL